MSKVTSISRFCITTGLGAGLLKSPLVVRLMLLQSTGRRDSGHPFTADDVSVNKELHACGFCNHSYAIILIINGIIGMETLNISRSRLQHGGRRPHRV